jgi:hypothetical protein
MCSPSVYTRHTRTNTRTFSHTYTNTQMHTLTQTLLHTFTLLSSYTHTHIQTQKQVGKRSWQAVFSFFSWIPHTVIRHTCTSVCIYACEWCAFFHCFLRIYDLDPISRDPELEMPSKTNWTARMAVFLVAVRIKELPFLFKDHRIGTCSYFSADFATQKTLLSWQWILGTLLFLSWFRIDLLLREWFRVSISMTPFLGAQHQVVRYFLVTACFMK